MSKWTLDIRLALRSSAKNPWFAAVAVSLAIGIGANTSIFSVANALLLRPLPYDNPDRLVILWNRSPGLGITQDWFSPDKENATDWSHFELELCLPVRKLAKITSRSQTFGIETRDNKQVTA
jgi:hypothetical protein